MNNIYFILLLSGLFTWGMTALGASLIFFFKNAKQIYLDAMLGFAAGVMICASFTSLIIPALDYSRNTYINDIGIFIVSSGIFAGTLALMGIDRIIPHLHPFENIIEGPKTSLHRSILLILSITLHNIPEGLAVGVAYGAYAITKDPILLTGAVSLTLGIGIQNFPEGSAVAFPLLREGYSKRKVFLWSTISSCGTYNDYYWLLFNKYNKLSITFFLGFAAGAMLFVVIEELIPESQSNKNIHIVTIATVLGLIVMLMLDVILG